MNALLLDVRQSLRSLLRTPGFTAIAILTIALGIGANTAIYSLVDHMLFRPLPFLDTDRLVAVWETAPNGNDHNEFSPANFTDLRAQSRTMSHVVAHSWTNANLTGGDRPERVQGFAVTADYFDALGLTPMLGRGFRKGEDAAGSDGVVVLTHELWTRRFGANRDIVGTSITVNGRSRQVVGVMPEGVKYPSPAELYVPWAPTPERLASRNAHFLLVTGRLAPGVTAEQAHAEVSSIMARLSAQYPATNAKWGANTKALLPDTTRILQPIMIVLLAAVGFVLLVACANMANLMLARGVARQRDTFVRAALGASGGRLASRVFVESAILVAVGGTLGVLVGILGLRGLVAIVPSEHARFIPGFDRVAVDGTVLLVTTVVVVGVTLLVSLLPAIRAARSVSLDASMRANSRGVAGGKHRVRGALVAMETGLAIMLLVGAGLTVRTFAYLSNRDTGVDATRTALATVSLPSLRYADPDAQRRFYRDALAGMRALPGVETAGASDIIPMCQCNSTTWFQIDGAPFPEGERPDVGRRVVTPGYLGSLGVRMVGGRDITDADRADAPRVVLVNESFAARWFPDGALGKRITFSDTARYTIVGVVRDIRHEGPAAEPKPEVYLAFDQRPTAEMTFTVRAASGDAQGDAASLLPAMRTVVGGLDPELPVYDTRTMDAVARLAIGPVRLSVSLLSTLAALALVLAMVGVYGVASQLVAERTREIGIRVALGSAQAGVVRFIMRRGLRSVTIGAILGLVGAGLLSRGLASQLTGVKTLDPLTYVSVALLLFSAALVAIYSPARRVSRIDPMVVLRAEDQS
ncbi:MAG: ABC transporter permease [Gemmatimonadota bacterium]